MQETNLKVVTNQLLINDTAKAVNFSLTGYFFRVSFFLYQSLKDLIFKANVSKIIGMPNIAPSL